METEDEVYNPNHGYNPNHWQDLLLQALKDDADSSALLGAMSSVLGPAALLGIKPTSEKSNSIKLSNPKKLQSDYSLIDGNSVNIQYEDEDDFVYVYGFKVRTDPKNTGYVKIFKQKFEDNVYIEFDRPGGVCQSKQYRVEELADFQSFMGKIVGVIINQ